MWYLSWSILLNNRSSLSVLWCLLSMMGPHNCPHHEPARGLSLIVRCLSVCSSYYYEYVGWSKFRVWTHVWIDHTNETTHWEHATQSSNEGIRLLGGCPWKPTRTEPNGNQRRHSYKQPKRMRTTSNSLAITCGEWIVGDNLVPRQGTLL